MARRPRWLNDFLPVKIKCNADEAEDGQGQFSERMRWDGQDIWKGKEKWDERESERQRKER